MSLTLATLLSWIALGALCGLLVWAFSSRPDKYLLRLFEKIIQGIIGAEIIGLITLTLNPPWPLVVSYIAAAAGGFFLPYSLMSRHD